MKKGVASKIKQRIEFIEGLPINEALSLVYIKQLLSYRKICDRWSINNRTLIRLMKECNIEPRKGGDAIKTQWINAEKRKKETSKRFSEIRNSITHPMLGKKRPDASIRMKIKNPMFNQEVRRKANQKTIETYNKEPYRMAQYHKPLTYCEQKVFDFIKGIGIFCIGNELVNNRFVDIFIPEYNIAIECVNSSRFPLSFDRHSQISENNVRVIYCTNDFIKKSDLNVLHYYISNLNVFGHFPSINGKETVIFGRRNGIIFDTYPNNFRFNCINVNSQNVLFFTASADN